MNTSSTKTGRGGGGNSKINKQKNKTFAPKVRSIDEINAVVSRYDQIDLTTVTSFADLPLSQRTVNGLSKSGYETPSDVQRESIGIALRGMDLLGAAKTGSGKTLAFLIPALECLWRERWNKLDGLGVLIISPTRELAYQTFTVFRNVGRFHDFSTALLVGGNDAEYEKRRLAGTNIVVCTPGRLLQHMDENALFNYDSLKLLVLDEADRILDMGFKQQLNAILENLPKERQTLLFSATQTRSVKDLARLSLHDPVYVSVHEHAQYSTPENLKQSYLVCADEDKINLLWSFLTNHKHKKVLVFMNSCKEVRFIYEMFRHLRPGMTVLALYGTMNQNKRTVAYQSFERKQHAALFATDIAARGLDFTAVDWVLQLDCPSDVDEYIHRSGRTARYNSHGEALLVLTPAQETPMIEQLTSKRIPIQRIDANPKKMADIRRRMESTCAQFTYLKGYAQKCFVSYMRSMFLMRNKSVFDVKTVDCTAFAQSLGLTVVPRVRFLKKQGVQLKQTAVTDRNDEDDAITDKLKSAAFVDDDSDDDNDTLETPLLHVKQSDIFNVAAVKDFDNAVASSKREKLPAVPNRSKILRKAIRQNVQLNKKKMFADDDSDDGNEISAGLNIEEALAEMASIDKEDKQRSQQRQRNKKLAKKRKVKQEQSEEQSEKIPRLAELGGLDDQSGASDGKYGEMHTSKMTQETAATDIEKLAMHLLQ